MATMHLSVYSYKKIVLSQRKPRDAEAILFGLKFANDIHYKLRCSQASIKQGFRASNIDCDLNAAYSVSQPPPPYGFLNFSQTVGKF